VRRVVALTRQYSWIILGILLLCAVSLLPPDTSLSEVKADGTLTACVPAEREPLVMSDPQRPGVEVELLTQIASAIGVKLQLNTIASMGEDFDPQSWGITRAQCAVVAGGLVDSTQTRSFLEVSPSYAETGWVAISPKELPSLEGRSVGVLATVQGFNRIALASYLRSQGVQMRILRTGDELVQGLATGAFDAGITEALMGESLSTGKNWLIRPLPAPLERYPLVFGLWKGDLTLKRAVDDAFDRMQADGRLAAVLKKYGVVGAPGEGP